MAFESLSDRLQNVFKNLRGRGRPSEADVKAVLEEVKMALLETDVGFKVVKQFTNSVQERTIGRSVLNNLTPEQMVIEIVHKELINLMGSKIAEITLGPSSEITVIVMAGLQGADETTTTIRIAGRLKTKRGKPLPAACDAYRLTAIQQLQINGEKQGVAVLSMGDSQEPVNIIKVAIEHAGKNSYNMVILDTVSRLHVGENMMDGLIEIKEAITVDQTLLVVDATTGQDIVNVAEMFNSKVGIDGVVLTKLDDNTRGSAALSARAATGRSVLYIDMGERLSDLEQFYPDRMASRILGMGDILSLIEKAELEVDEQKAGELNQKLKKAEFNYNGFLGQICQVKEIGGMSNTINMMPGMPQMKRNPEIDESATDRVEAIILFITAQERANPAVLSPSRKQWVARGADVGIGEVSRVVKQFDQMKEMMKQLPGTMDGKGKGNLGGMLGKFKIPF